MVELLDYILSDSKHLIGTVVLILALGWVIEDIVKAWRSPPAQEDATVKDGK